MNDKEMGILSGVSNSRSEKVGPYQFIWADGEDSYEGIGLRDDIDATDIPN